MVRGGRGVWLDVVLNLGRLAYLVFIMTRGLARVPLVGSQGGCEGARHIDSHGELGLTQRAGKGAVPTASWSGTAVLGTP